MQRMEIIRQRLQNAFKPSVLEVIDDSDKHKGHVGSRGGAGHYTIIISNESFQHLTRVAAHQKIYAVLADLIPEQIHALQIRITG